MILFFAPYPKSEGVNGYLQRVLYVDHLFKDFPRVYVDLSDVNGESISIREESSKGIEAIITIDGTNPEHLRYVQTLASHASLIYVHSILRAVPLSELYHDPILGPKIVTDLHGVVPEEYILEGKKEEAQSLEKVEHFAVHQSGALVAVTQQMIAHFKTKYPQLKDKRIFLLPVGIHPDLSSFSVENKILDDKDGQATVIYSGGIDAWQNTERMIVCITNLPPSIYVVILSPFIGYFEKKLRSLVNRGRVQVGYLKPTEVPQVYEKATYGFVLRDVNLVNSVACPTKLIEYMAFGVIPIVLNPKIGDFFELGYRFVRVEDFESHVFPDLQEQKDWMRHNREVFLKLYRISADTASELREMATELTHSQSIRNATFLALYQIYTRDIQSQLRIASDELKVLKEGAVSKLKRIVRHHARRAFLQLQKNLG